MKNEDTPRRDFDELSVASDFSIIPENFAGQDDSVLNETRSMASGASFLKSEDLQPSAQAETSFGKVLFQNIQATYTADSDIAVSYILTSSVTAKSSDRVALYRVGFGSPQDYLSYQWAPTPSKDHTLNQLPLTVVFKASSLPKDAGEFFQFCYMTHEGHIVGVSTPFQLLQVGSLSLSNVCGVDDGEDGMVVVCSSESLFHDKINKLSQQIQKLLLEVSSQQQLAEQKQKEMDDKTQQLSMCQHHLQALETKMKKETTEKCELMGRIGQVVEEKGHLEDRVKTLDRSLATSTARVEELESQLQTISSDKKKLEEELLRSRKHREQLDHALLKCQEELSECEDKLKNTADELEQTKGERNNAVKELEFWTSTAAADKDEKNSLALRFTTVNEELIKKLEELEQSKKIVKQLEDKLINNVMEMADSKDKLKETEEKLAIVEEQKKIHEEREAVVNQDNHQLKATICQLKDKIEQLEDVQERDQSGREAAEKIASDLSGRLQDAKAEYQTLALTNLRLVKKIKKLRQSMNLQEGSTKTSVMTSSVSSQASMWLHVDNLEEDGTDDLEVTADGDEMEEVSKAMIQSCTSALTQATCSTCSHTTQQLSEVVHQKMEDIVRELSLQIDSLKMQLQARQVEAEPHAETDSDDSRQSQELGKQPVVQQLQQCQQQQEELPQQKEPEQEREQEQNGRNKVVLEERTAAAESAGNDDDQQVLYSNSFLRAARTAPVFLPEGETETSSTFQEASSSAPQPSAPPSVPPPYIYMPCSQVRGSVTPSLMMNNTVSGATLSAPKAHIPTTQPISGTSLPPPLQPETTPTAIQAAVMSQFTSQPLPGSQGHDSDDDDFHSTSDNDDSETLTTPQNHSMIQCPMCSLSFQPGALRLVQEHMNSHLEHVCPVCSMAFQKNEEKRFQDHVHDHFKEEDEDDQNSLDDPSGPWGQAFSAFPRLEFD